MLQSIKNKETLSILDRLKKQGMPQRSRMSSLTEEDPDDIAPEDEEADAASGVSAPDTGELGSSTPMGQASNPLSNLRKKKKPTASY